MNKYWVDYRSRNFSRMGGDRALHPSRAFVDRIIDRRFPSGLFTWFEVGVLSMVDYKRLRRKFSKGFTYTAIDISPPIIAKAELELSSVNDRILEWDVQIPFGNMFSGRRFGLVTVRAVLNHCADYETALKNLRNVCIDGGLVIITLHVPLVGARELNLDIHNSAEDTNQLFTREIGVSSFFESVRRANFAVHRFVRFVDKWKSCDVIVLAPVDKPERYVLNPEIVYMRPVWWRFIRAITPGIFKRFRNAR